MDRTKSSPSAHAWTYPVWFGMNCGDHMFGGTVQPGGDTFIAIFTTEARAERFIAADPEPDAIEASAMRIEDEESFHEWLTDLKQSGYTHVAFDPIAPIIEPGRALEIRALLATLKAGE
jgi:hypothetical protein